MTPDPKFWLDFSKVPKDLWLNPHVKSLTTVRVYCALAAKMPKNVDVASIGQTLIADTLGINRRSVRRAIDELVGLGLVAKEPNAPGRREIYRVTAKAFKYKAGEPREPKVHPRDLPDMVSAPRHSAWFGVVGKAHLENPPGKSGVPIMRSPEEMEARRLRRLVSAPRRKTA